MNQLASPAWADFLYDRHARFIQIILRGEPFNQHKIVEQFIAQKKPLAELPLGWSEKMPPPRMRSGSRHWAIANKKRKHYPK